MGVQDHTTETMPQLRRVPGCHVYGGMAPLAEAVTMLPKAKNIIFNVDLDESDMKELPTFKVPFEAGRPVPFSCFDVITKALNDEDDKTNVYSMPRRNNLQQQGWW